VTSLNRESVHTEIVSLVNSVNNNLLGDRVNGNQRRAGALHGNNRVFKFTTVRVSGDGRFERDLRARPELSGGRSEDRDRLLSEDRVATLTGELDFEVVDVRGFSGEGNRELGGTSEFELELAAVITVVSGLNLDLSGLAVEVDDRRVGILIVPAPLFELALAGTCDDLLVDNWDKVEQLWVGRGDEVVKCVPVSGELQGVCETVWRDSQSEHVARVDEVLGIRRQPCDHHKIVVLRVRHLHVAKLVVTVVVQVEIRVANNALLGLEGSGKRVEGDFAGQRSVAAISEELHGLVREVGVHAVVRNPDVVVEAWKVKGSTPDHTLVLDARTRSINHS